MLGGLVCRKGALCHLTATAVQARERDVPHRHPGEAVHIGKRAAFGLAPMDALRGLLQHLHEQYGVLQLGKLPEESRHQRCQYVLQVVGKGHALRVHQQQRASSFHSALVACSGRRSASAPLATARAGA